MKKHWKWVLAALLIAALIVAAFFVFGGKAKAADIDSLPDDGGETGET